MIESWIDYDRIERRLWEEKVILLRRLEKINRALDNIIKFKELRNNEKEKTNT